MSRGSGRERRRCRVSGRAGAVGLPMQRLVVGLVVGGGGVDGV